MPRKRKPLVIQRHAISLQIFHFKMSKCIPLPQSKLILSYSSAVKRTLRRKRAKCLDFNQAAHLLLIEEHNSPLSDTRKSLLRERFRKCVIAFFAHVLMLSVRGAGQVSDACIMM